MRKIDKLCLRKSRIRKVLRSLKNLLNISSQCTLRIETDNRQDIVERFDESGKLCASDKIPRVPLAHLGILPRREDRGKASKIDNLTGGS
ncbi:MAG: hypothetical protein HY290_26730 [Planctomycetia bacterium]|nr:hypothetical protein [Planctomycetia bacterium]